MEGLDRFGQFLNRRELRALQGRLQDGESVLAAVEATKDRRGVLAATDRRVLFVWRSWLGARHLSWRHGRWQRQSSRDGAVLILVATGPPVRFTDVAKEAAKDFEASVARRPLQPGELADFTPPPGELARRKRIERLDRMFARGTLTKAEYERAKATAAADDE